VANKVITVGTASRAEIIASFFDESPTPIRINSSRGFLTITGYYQGTRVSVVAIGMVCLLSISVI
jgi:uridine phosphorylase